MQFALLGANETSMPLLRAAKRLGHRCVALLDAPEWHPRIAALWPDVRTDIRWELLLGPPPIHLPHSDGQQDVQIEAVVVAPTADIAAASSTGAEQRELRADQLRKLAAAVMPMLAVTPVCEAIVGYELDMIRRDTRVILFPYSPLAAHAGAAKLAALSESPSAEIGQLQQFQLERTANVTTDQQRLEWFALDAHLLDHVLGGLREVAASSSREGTLEQLAAHVDGQRGIARWNLVGGPKPQLKATALGDQGRIEWTVCDSPLSEWEADFGKGQWTANESQDELNDDGAEAAWHEFAALCKQQADSPAAATGSTSERSQSLPWDGACRAAEVADETPRSVRRGRSVAMQDQTPTEEDTFKGIMAAGSCGMLLLVLTIFVVGGIIESVRFPAKRSKYIDQSPSMTTGQDGANETNPTGPRRSIWLRIWPVYPLALLLLLQLFRLVFVEEARASGAEPTAETPEET